MHPLNDNRPIPAMKDCQKKDAPVAQLVEHLTLNQGVQGSSPCGCTKPLKVAKADMAQLVEQRIRNAWVPGSSPGIGSKRWGGMDSPLLFRMNERQRVFSHSFSPCGNSSVGRALASQAEGRGFESRLPLFCMLQFSLHFFRETEG